MNGRILFVQFFIETKFFVYWGTYNDCSCSKIWSWPWFSFAKKSKDPLPSMLDSVPFAHSTLPIFETSQSLNNPASFIMWLVQPLSLRSSMFLHVDFTWLVPNEKPCLSAVRLLLFRSCKKVCFEPSHAELLFSTYFSFWALIRLLAFFTTFVTHVWQTLLLCIHFVGGQFYRTWSISRPQWNVNLFPGRFDLGNYHYRNSKDLVLDLQRF